MGKRVIRDTDEQAVVDAILDCAVKFRLTKSNIIDAVDKVFSYMDDNALLEEAPSKKTGPQKSGSIEAVFVVTSGDD